MATSGRRKRRSELRLEPDDGAPLLHRWLLHWRSHRERRITILYDPRKQWLLDHDDLACKDPENVDLFFHPGNAEPSEKPPPRLQKRWDRAKVLCSQCPVMRQCQRDNWGQPTGVYGGLDEHQRWLTRRLLRSRARYWPQGRRLAWGREIARLRAGRVAWSAIQRATGIRPSLAGDLLKDWEDHLERLRARRAPVLHLPDYEPGEGHDEVDQAA